MSEYSYCHICRVNHNTGRRHIYSSKHKKLLQNVLNRFAAKVKRCCKGLSSPVILDGEYEPGGSFWCHFCRLKCMKHVTDRELTIQHGGVYEHLASEDHVENVKIFWKDNGTDEKFKDDFVITGDQFTRYKSMVEENLKQHVINKSEHRTKVVQNLRLQEKKRKDILSQPAKSEDTQDVPKFKTVRNSKGILQNPTGWHDGVRVWGGGIVKYQHGSGQWIPWEMDAYVNTKKGVNDHAHNKVEGHYTVRAIGEGLTAISTPNVKGWKRGNVHTGATPPWLLNDDDDELTPKEFFPRTFHLWSTLSQDCFPQDYNMNIFKSKACTNAMGPSEELFREYVEKKKRRKQLKSKKVGANFDHSQVTSEDWLPSFGRVWNSGPRWQSRRQFRKEQSRNSRS